MKVNMMTATKKKGVASKLNDLRLVHEFNRTIQKHDYAVVPISGGLRQLEDKDFFLFLHGDMLVRGYKLMGYCTIDSITPAMQAVLADQPLTMECADIVSADMADEEIMSKYRFLIITNTAELSPDPANYTISSTGENFAKHLNRRAPNVYVEEI